MSDGAMPAAPFTGEGGGSVPAARLSRGAHLAVVASIGLFFAAGLALQPVTRGDRETILTLLGWPLPTFCWFKLTTGLPCASCGLTRSVALLLHGHVSASLALHPFGVVAVVLALLQLPPRIARVAGGSGFSASLSRRDTPATAATSLRARGAAQGSGRWIALWDRIWAVAALASVVLMFVRWVEIVGLRSLLAAWSAR